MCRTYHGITRFRGTLLGLLPIASGTAVGLLLQYSAGAVDSSVVAALGLFGFFATLGLFFYELRGIDRCKALIDLGERLEKELGFVGGQFVERPGRKWGIIGSDAAGWLVYGTMLIAWGYVIRSSAV